MRAKKPMKRKKKTPGQKKKEAEAKKKKKKQEPRFYTKHPQDEERSIFGSRKEVTEEINYWLSEEDGQSLAELLDQIEVWKITEYKKVSLCPNMSIVIDD